MDNSTNTCMSKCIHNQSDITSFTILHAMEPDSCHFLKQIKAKLISIKPPHRPDPQMFALENGNAQVISNLQREKIEGESAMV